MNRTFVAVSVPGKAAAGSCSPASPPARQPASPGNAWKWRCEDAGCCSETDEFMRDDEHVFVQRTVTLRRYRTMDTGRGRFPFELPVRRLLFLLL